MSLCQHQWDLDSSWVKDTHKGLLKVLRIKLEGLTDQKRDCTAILVQILEQPDITNIFLMGSDTPEDPSLHKLWHKAQATGLTFICFHPHGERLSGNIMGIQRIHNGPALRHRQVKDDKMPKSFCPWCCKYGRNTTTIANHIWQDHYKLGMVCPQCKSHISTCHEDLKSHLIQCRKGGIQGVRRNSSLGHINHPSCSSLVTLSLTWHSPFCPQYLPSNEHVNEHASTYLLPCRPLGIYAPTTNIDLHLTF